MTGNRQRVPSSRSRRTRSRNVRYLTAAQCTRLRQQQRQNRQSRPITVGQRADRLVRGLRSGLDAIREDQQATRQRNYGYGLAKVETERVFREIDRRGFLHMVDVISGDEIDGIMAFEIDGSSTAFVYPGNFPGQLRSDGTIFSGRFKDNGSMIRFYDGTQNQADPDLIGSTSLPSSFIGRGISYVYTKLKFIEGRFSGDPSMTVYARMRKAVDPRDSRDGLASFNNLPKRFTINPYVMIYDALMRPFDRGGIGFSPEMIDTLTFARAADYADEPITTKQFSRVAILTTRSNQSAGQPPVATNHLLEFNEPVLAFTYGDIVRVTPSSGQQLPGNLARGIDYYVIPVRPAVGDFQIPAMALAMSLSDALAGNSLAIGRRTTDVTITKVRDVRYTSGFSTSGQIEDSIDQLLESCGASLYTRDGKIVITSQQFPEPDKIQVVTEDHLTGPVALSNRMPSSDRATELSGSFNSLQHLFFPRDYPAATGNGAYAEADGIDLPQRRDYPYAAKATVAQRLARVELRRQRQERTIGLSGTLELYRLRPNTIFSLNKPSLGLDPRTTFEVRSQNIFVEIDQDRPFIGVDVSARQLESDTYNLDVAEETLLDEANIPGLSSPFDVEPPGVPVIVESLYIAREGAGLKNRASIEWEPSQDPFIEDYQVSYRRTEEPRFIFLPVTPDRQIRIDDIEPGEYLFRVQAINSLGRKSDPELAQTIRDILGLAAPPAAPSGFSGEVIGSASVLLQWMRSTDLDVVEGGRVELRHDPDPRGMRSQHSTLIEFEDGGRTSIQASFRFGTYYLRFHDIANQTSDFVAWSTQDRRPVPYARPIVNGAFTPNDDNEDTFTIMEDPSFPSTNPANTLVGGSEGLTLPLETSFDDILNVDTVMDVDMTALEGLVFPDGVYFFSTGIELLQVQRVLIEAIIQADVFDASDSLDDVSNVDEINDVDSIGEVANQPGAATAWIEARVSRDNAASDNFGPWERVTTSIFFHRTFQFRIVAMSTIPTVNIRITRARIRATEAPLPGSVQ